MAQGYGFCAGSMSAISICRPPYCGWSFSRMRQAGRSLFDSFHLTTQPAIISGLFFPRDSIQTDHASSTGEANFEGGSDIALHVGSGALGLSPSSRENEGLDAGTPN
jgi:hypothetical protein